MEPVRPAGGAASGRSRQLSAGVGVTEGLARLGQDPYSRRRPTRVTARMRRRRLRASLIVVVLLVLIIVVASQGGSTPASGHSATVAASKKAPIPYLALSTESERPAYVPGDAPQIPWPTTGQAAIAVPSAGVLETSGAETPVPIASLTKMMTLYLTLKQHPLTSRSAGPLIKMTAVDQEGYDNDVVSDASSIEVQAGEVLNERQVLTALVVRSANNLADTLARWDAQSIPAFVERMNTEAAALGMDSTHYVDTNGLHPGSQSTARDQLVMAEHGLAEPGFESIVDQPAVTLPITGTLPNYVTAVGSDGVIGVKSGFTDAALACVVLAAVRQVGGKPVVILAADLGQEAGLYYAQSEDLQMIAVVAQGLQLQTVVPAHHVVGTLSLKNASADASGKLTAVPVETATALTAVAWPDTNVVVEEKTLKMGRSVKAGAEVGTLEAISAGGTPFSVPLIATASIRG
ncbi:MAG: hypothetical protein WAM97_01505 [Acidimicrobiales bacterium]